MPRFIIERNMPGVGALSKDQARQAAQKSNEVLEELGPKIQWVESFVTDNKIYCVYIAPNEELVRQHAKKAGFPADKISLVKQVLDPVSAEEMLSAPEAKPSSPKENRPQV
jgi:enamine deaminase RidA (YjgF/YER057c/UK114 family)